MKQYDKVIGQKFGRLTIKSFSERIPFPSGSVSYRYICECECGNTVTVALCNLRSGHTKSCGCYFVNQLSERKTHGLTKHPLYRVWKAMKSRCYDEKCSSYYNYGARGIKVCDEWQTFEPFYDWCITNGWRKGLELDRFPDVNGDYKPTNCRFATRKQQQNNKRNTVRTMYNGELLTISEISDKSGIPYGTVYSQYRTSQKQTSKGITL